MATDIRFSVPNTPGSMERAARALANEGVSISGVGCDIRPGERWGYIHFLVTEPETAIRALQDIGVEILDVHEVDVLDTEERVGFLADVCKSYTERGENIEVLYAGMHEKIIVGTESQRRPFVGRRLSETKYSDGLR